MRGGRARLYLAVLIGGLLTSLISGAELREDPVVLDRSNLEQVEDLSESLANALLDFSRAVRDKELDQIARFFPSSLEASRWPVGASGERETVKWIEHRSLSGAGLAPAEVNERNYLENWRTYLDGFSQIEDARFKVKDASFLPGGEGVRSEGVGIKFFLVGRDGEGRRTWNKGTGHLDVEQSGDGWTIHRFHLDEFHHYTAAVDLFSEVSAAAGLSLELPAYGTPGNDDFIYHGGAAGDLDQDGWVDLVVSHQGGVFIYLNQGDGTFLEAGEKLGMAPLSQITAPILLDYDNDGDLDLFLAAVGNQRLFHNELKESSRLGFADYSIEAGVNRGAVGYSATVGDVNSDGFPDIYVAGYNRFGTFMPNSWHRATNGTPNLLFINRGNGSFREAAEEWGVRDTRWSYSAVFSDLDSDGRQDLYVANDFGENGLYLNQGGHFKDLAAERGLLDPGNGMGASLGDFNNDGHLDLYVTNMSSTAGNRILNRLFPGSDMDENVLRKLAAGSSVFQGDSKGHFTDVTEELGPFSQGWGWGGIFTDFDNDGWQDLYSTNGFVSGKSMKDT